MNICFCADASEQSARVLVEKLNAGGSTDAVNPQIIIPAPNPKPVSRMPERCMLHQVPSLLMPDDEACAAKPPSLATRVVIPNPET